jgi:hypothetical protein
MSTFINSSTTLPNVPSLPPIQIPNSFRASVDNHLPPLDEDSHLSPHAFTSFSPTHRQPIGSNNDAQTSPTNVSPVSSNLRKSYSVDSFSRHPRPPPVSVVARQQRASPVASPSDEQRRAAPPTRQPHAVDSPHVSYQARDPSFLSLAAVVVQALAPRVMKPVNQYRRSQTESLCVMRLQFPLGPAEGRDQNSGGGCVPLCLLESFHSHQSYTA